MSKNKFYITTTLPYVNADPHIGFALELIQADVIARHHRQRGAEVMFNTGTDEHGLKIYRNALEAGKDPQIYANEYAGRFSELTKALNVSTTLFIRTTDAHHEKAAQEFWRRCLHNGDIYKKNYKIKYCVGCELEKTDSELVKGYCPIHPNLQLETIEEENYFFRFSKYQQPLLELYEEHSDFVLPSFRSQEIKNFVKQGLNDFSISRLKLKMPWGIPVPDDQEQVMYVWFDALVNYISTLGWPEDEKTFLEFWPGVQIAGKDNLRQQSAIWQAMLMSAGLPASKQILIHGFITADGQKISKSLGNVIDPFEVVQKNGADVVRYYLLREIPSGDDGDFSHKNLESRYNSDLANGLGNFTARVLTLAAKETFFEKEKVTEKVEFKIKETKAVVDEKIRQFKLHEALAHIWELLAFGDAYVNETQAWKREDKNVIFSLVTLLDNVAFLLQSFMPETAEKITKRIVREGNTLTIQPGEILFPRRI